MADITRTETGDADSDHLIAGRYERWQKVGQGGMGEVWEGFDHTLERRIALKCPPVEALINVKARKRFMTEARTMAKLKHPHMVQVHDVVDEGPGQPLWIVMDFIDGFTAGQWVEEHQRFEPAQAVSIAMQVCDALAHAHEAKIIHRDIKPSNIMFDRAGWAWVMDFGIARHIKNTMYTLTGQQTTGTLAYMAPEQHLGKDKDPRVDIYALGATLYEMVTGRMPFEDIPDMRAAKLESAFDEPGEVVEDLPAALNDLIVKCLSPNAEDRYADTRALAQALGECGVEVSVPNAPAPTSPTRRPKPEPERKRDPKPKPKPKPEKPAPPSPAVAVERTSEPHAPAKPVHQPVPQTSSLPEAQDGQKTSRTHLITSFMDGAIGGAIFGVIFGVILGINRGGIWDAMCCAVWCATIGAFVLGAIGVVCAATGREHEEALGIAVIGATFGAIGGAIIGGTFGAIIGVTIGATVSAIGGAAIGGKRQSTHK